MPCATKTVSVHLSCFQNTLPTDHTDKTTFTFVAINLGKSYLKTEASMESRLEVRDAAQCDYRLSSQEEVWLLRPRSVKRQLTSSGRRFEDSQLCARPKSNSPENRVSCIRFISLELVSLLPPGGAPRRPLNSEDIFRSLRFRKYSTKLISTRLGNES